jgi:hypothetical protein
MRVLGFAIGVLALLGCALTHAPLPEEGEPPVAANRPPDSSGDSEPASGTATEPDTLTLAAECLERGDQAGAATHLESYVCRYPDQLMFRAQLAEMLLRLGRDGMARVHYERFAADAQSATGPVRGQLVNAHTRLMEIAQRSNDRFGELFHRGVGLLLLTREQERQTPADADPAFAEEMLCKALLALREARELKPSDARTRAYLAEAYDRCGNRRAAEAERAGIRNALVPGELTAAERRSFPISCQVGR